MKSFADWRGGFSSDCKKNENYQNIEERILLRFVENREIEVLFED